MSRNGQPLRLAAPPFLLAVLVLIYLATVLPHLATNPILGGDEGWIMSAGAKLADQGVFGSDLFTGFYHVEDHYYFNLPLHHVALAAAFKLLGAGVFQARLVSVLFGLAALLLTYAIGRRVAGDWAGLLAAALLVLLRLNLAPFSGLTLTDMGATVRYDLIAVPYGLGAMLLLLRRPDDPSALSVGAAGVLVGLATLTQFIGGLFALPLGLFLLSLSLPWPRRLLLAAVFAGALALTMLPFGVYAGAHWDDFRGQSRAVDQQTDFLSPAFYIDQLKDEHNRYAISTGLESFPTTPSELASRPSARLVMVLAGPLAAGWMLYRGRRDLPRRLVGLTLVCLVVELALVDSTKRFEYWVAVVPPLCVALADLALSLWRWRPSEPALQLTARVVVVGVLALFALEGTAVAAQHVRDAGSNTDYAALGRHLEHDLPPGSVVVGDNRLWPALRHLDYRSWLLLFYFTNPEITGSDATDVAGAMDRIGPDYILMSPLSRDILRNLTPRDAADLDRYLATRTEEIASIPDRDYGPVTVYRVLK